MQAIQLITIAFSGVSIALLIALIIRKEERSAEWLHSALSEIGDAMIKTDAQGRIRTLNGVAEKLTGWTLREAAGKPSLEILRLLNHDTREPMEDPVLKMLKSREIHGALRNAVLISRNGYEWPVDCGAVLIRGRGGRIRGAVILFRDITERYTGEQNLIESEERLKAVTDTARIGLVMVDRERRYAYANNYYLQMVGLSGSNVTGRSIADVLPVLYERIRPYLDRAFAGERLSYEISGLKYKERGLNRVYSVTYEPQARQSLIMHVIIVVVDITDAKKQAATPQT